MKRGTVLRTKNILQYVLALIAGLCMPLNITHAQTAQVPEQVDSNFVIASIIIADPGDVLYSTVGHVGIHMQCPEHNLDYVFSYESEDARSKVLRFLSGKLRMGLAAIPYQEYLDMFRPQGRGVKEYTLYLPIEVKRNLWRVLDNHLMEGMDLPYDYMNRGCANSTLKLLMEGMDTLKISFGKWPQKFNLTRRELTEIQMKNVPWTWCFMNLICNGQIDAPCNKIDKVIMPADLIEVLKDATVQGKPLMQKEPTTLLPDNHIVKPCLFTPFVLSILVLLLTILCAVYKSGIMDYTLLAVQTILGLITIYLVFFSTLPCTEWSWLIIPFNPLPLIFWKWRQKWSLPYAIIIGIWALVMWLWPHTLTDATYIVLAIALIASYINIFRTAKTNKKI
ncbi:MAG: DUF4105 domain-containing protein [Bacteroidaceae bacterium]|nr:DUF4105 domain-containing protein [Bacteroidaceae bacterium]